MERFFIAITLTAVLAACNNNGDLDDDGQVSASEYCETLVRLECEIARDCGDLGEISVETCIAESPTCNYLAARCDYDEDFARDCITEVSAYSATCEPGDGNPLDAETRCVDFDSEGAVFSDCDFGE